MMNQRPSTLLFIFLLVLLLTLPASGAGVKTIYHLPFPGSITAADWNPALLGVSPYIFTAQFNPLALNLWTNAWTPNQILLNFNEFWDDDFKKELIDSIAGESFSTGMDLASGVYLGSSSWAFRSGIKGSMSLGFDKDIFHILLHGTGPDPAIKVDLSDNFANANLILDTAFSKAVELPLVAELLEWDTFYAGGGLHFLMGLAWLDLDAKGKLETVFDDDDIYFQGIGELDIRRSIIGVNGGGGAGTALDIGVWGEPMPNLGVGVSLTNLGFMRWDGVYRTYYGGEFEFDHPLSQREEENGDDDPLFDEIIDEPYKAQFVPTPISIQAGAYYAVHPRIDVAGGFGLSQDPVNHLKMSLGSRFHFPRILPLTVVMEYASYKGTPSMAFSFGLRLGGLEPLTVTFSDIKLVAGAGKEATICLHTSLRF